MSTEKQIKLKMFSIIRQVVKLIPQLVKKLKAEIMVRNICKEEGLTEKETEIIVATIKCESNMDVNFQKKCPNGTTDWGICAINDYWYWKKEQVIHPQEALNNPEKSVKLMISQYKKGRLKDWLCYQHELYRRFL